MTIVICNHCFALGRFKAFNVWQLWGSVTNEKVICHHLHPIYSPFSFSLFISRFFSFFASCFSSFSLYFQPLFFASPAFIQVIFGVFRAFFGEPCVVLAFGETSSRGDDSTPSISGHEESDPIDPSSDSWGESRIRSGEVTLATDRVEPIPLSMYEGTSTAVVEPLLRIPLVDRPEGSMAGVLGPCPMCPSRLLGLLLINWANKLKEEDLSRIKYYYGMPDGVEFKVPYKERGLVGTYLGGHASMSFHSRR
ncbi:hypothetical protein ACOSQ3_014317 [Xanthoceras sorbifolium]